MNRTGVDPRPKAGEALEVLLEDLHSVKAGAEKSAVLLVSV